MHGRNCRFVLFTYAPALLTLRMPLFDPLRSFRLHPSLDMSSKLAWLLFRIRYRNQTSSISRPWTTRFLATLQYASICVTSASCSTDSLQGRHIYDFTEMNDALPSTPFLAASRRTFNPYGLTSGSRTQAKVRQIRGENRD